MFPVQVELRIFVVHELERFAGPTVRHRMTLGASVFFKLAGLRILVAVGARGELPVAELCGSERLLGRRGSMAFVAGHSRVPGDERIFRVLVVIERHRLLLPGSRGMAGFAAGPELFPVRVAVTAVAVTRQPLEPPRAQS